VRIANAAGSTASVTINSRTAVINAGLNNGGDALRVGEAGIGTLTQTDGTVNVNQNLSVGENMGSNGTYSISGGTLNVKQTNSNAVNAYIGRAGTGTLEVSGTAIVNVKNGAQLQLGAGAGNTGLQNVVAFTNVNTGIGTVTQTGGAVTVDGSNGTYQSNVLGGVVLGFDGDGTYNLNGGTLTTPMLGRGHGTATFNLGGGTLKANASSLNLDLPVNLTGTGAGKGAFDSNDFNLTFTSQLSGVGGFAKNGAGSLTVANSSSNYTGGTDVNGSNLIASGTALSTGNVNFGAAGTLTVQGTQQGLFACFYLLTKTDVGPALTNANVNMSPEFASLDNLNYFLAGKNSFVTESTAARGKVSINYLDLGGSNLQTALPPELIAAQGGGIPFIAQLTGKFNAATAGDYSFQTRSDDGSMLWIDGQAVLDNNRTQGQTPRTGTINLTAGQHDIVVGYYQGTGGGGFSVGITSPDQGQSFLIGSELNMSNAVVSYGSNVLTIGALEDAGSVQLNGGTLQAGSNNNSSSFTGTINGAGNLVKQGSGVMTALGAHTYTGNTTVSGGTLNVAALPNGANITAAAGAVLNVGNAGTGAIRQATLTVNGTATVLPSSPFTLPEVGNNGGTSHVGTLAIANGGGAYPRTYTGTLDLKNNDLIIDNATLPDVTDELHSGSAGAAWTGTGLKSSTAASSGGATALGVIQNIVNPVGGTGGALYSTFDGESTHLDGTAFNSTEILVKYTYAGDFNLGGRVDSFDFALLDAGFAGATQLVDGKPGWFFGDAN